MVTSRSQIDARNRTSTDADAAAQRDEGHIGAVITLRGVVQGVGFRPFVHRLARSCRLAGTVRNFSGGVTIEVEGPEDRVDEFYQRLTQEAPPLSKVLDKRMETGSPRGLRTFSVGQSTREEEPFVLVPPDVATCSNCLRELMDPRDRRYGYPFINCTDCGPRFTIIEDMPYDRPMTTMRHFTMCQRCQGEYEDIDHRRYHAQPNACPDCGPHLFFQDRMQVELHDQRALQEAVRRLRSGQIVAVRGIGGFHLCCDATDDDAVEKLRRRKGRPIKPLALMMPDVHRVRRWCQLSAAEEELICSSSRPIVVLQKRPRTPISSLVAPGNDTLGVMLPYAPVQALLLTGDLEAMVATSANLSGQPLIADNRQAVEELEGIADAFLLHDREIQAPCDDSILRIIEGHPVFLRRARGYVPLPVELPFEGPPVLACGAELKNTFCLTQGQNAFISQHIGDLKNLETYSFYTNMIEHFEHLFRLRPQLLAHDLHPQYLSTQYAQRWKSQDGRQLPKVAVQHHHAHLAACLADNGASGPVIGVIFDGAGYGSDGHVWGAEFMVADYGSFRRVGQLRYIPLPGGDAASREPWRMAISYLHELPGHHLDAEMRRRLRPNDDGALDAIWEILSRGKGIPLASSMGRLFDALSALLGLCQQNTYQGQAAVCLEVAARNCPDPVRGYPWSIDQTGGYLVVDPAPVIEAALQDHRQGMPVEQIARRFHHSVAELVGTCCLRLRARHGLETVALSGGVFQNGLLTEMTLKVLRKEGFRPLVHHQVPPNDGGIALGQAAVAAALNGGKKSCV